MAAQVIRIDHGRRYAAAKTNRSTGGWSPADASVNTLLSSSAATIRARIRQLVRDFPYFARAVNVIVDHVVGQGIHLQSKVAYRTGRVNTSLAGKIEDSWRRWMDEADISGRLHFYEMMRLAKRQDLECGEFIIIRRQSKNKNRYLPFALQMLEADWLTSAAARPKSQKSKISQGVEYDSDTGEPLAYHFADPDSYGKPVRVPASDVIHGFETLRPGQLRGISPFTAGVVVTRDLQDIMDGEIDGVKMAAKWLAFVTTMDPGGRQLQTSAAPAADDVSPLRVEELENTIIEYLQPGEDVKLATSKRPGDNFADFIRLVLGMLSVSTGVPYELLAGDYRGMSYSVSRASRNDFAYGLRPVAGRHIRHLCQPVFASFMESAVLAGRLPIPSFFRDPVPFLQTVWHPPGMEPVDPLKEGRAHADAVTNNLMSPQEILARRGRDIEDVYREIAEARRLREKYGLPDETTSNALATNPAALEKNGADK